MEKSLIHSYSAGLFDGEGSIQLSHIKKDDKYRRPAVSVASTTPELLSFLKDHYGGYISTKKTYKPHHKPSFEWKLSGIKVLEFLIHIKPYLLEPEKIRRCDLILNVYPKITIRNGKYSEDQDRIKKLFEQEFFHPSVP